jgi:hypothetical protein
MRLLALLILLALPLLAQPTSTSAPRVEVFSPQGTVKGVRQVAVRFSVTMVTFGDPRLPEPFQIECPAKGWACWADARNWVYDFNKASPRSGIGDRPRFLRDELGAGKAEGFIRPQEESLYLGRDPRERREAYRALCKAPLNQA